MKTFHYEKTSAERYSAQCRSLIAELYEAKGRAEMAISLYADELDPFRHSTFSDNIDASARIEGICVDAQRIHELIEGDEPVDDKESEVAGYAEALKRICMDPMALPPTTTTILSLHDDVFRGRSSDGRSKYRSRDEMYALIDGKTQKTRVSPVSAFETPLYLGAACDSLADAFDAGLYAPLALIPEFVVDFMCIRPFDEGNGRIARLFSELLLLRSGFDVVRYVSIDKLFERDAMGYYDALNACVAGWDRGSNDYEPFVMFWLRALAEAHEVLLSRTPVSPSGKLGKADRVRAFFSTREGTFTKRDIMEACPDIALSTVELALGQLVREGFVRKVGGGRSTAYERA